jgi:hypothetical protein
MKKDLLIFGKALSSDDELLLNNLISLSFAEQNAFVKLLRVLIFYIIYIIFIFIKI